MKRLAWWAALAAAALIAVFAQLDRASATYPALAPIVPAPLRGFAQAPLSMAALMGGEPAMAQAETRRLVRRRPLPADHLFILALADLRARDAAGYARAFERATERGWRAVPVQQAAARAALARGDSQAAANRIAALWALDPGDPTLPELTRALLARHTGRSAFAERIAGTKVWQDAFLQRAPEFGRAGAAVIEQAETSGARFDAALLQDFRDRNLTRQPPP